MSRKTESTTLPSHFEPNGPALVATVPNEPSPPATPPGPASAGEKQTIEHWKVVAGTPDWLWAGMKLGKRWPIGMEVTRAEYDAAVDWASKVECR